MLMTLAACGGEPSDSVVVPGAPPGGDPRPPISTVAPAPTTSPPSTVARSTTVAPAATTATTATTAAPPITPAATTTLLTTTTTAPASTTTAAPTTTELIYIAEPAEGALRVGVEGPRSLQVQQGLIALGILPSTAADSKYGPGTAAGVRRFQELKSLVVDGVAGPNTVAALAAAVAELNPPATTG